MNICIFGLWHLGTVIAACMARKGLAVTGLDYDKETISGLKKAQLPVYEPGLEELVRKRLEDGSLDFTADPAAALKEADAVWIAFDTPVDEDDRADIDFVERNILSISGFLRDGVRIIISSQVPVGFTARMEKIFIERFPDRKFVFAYSPENLRLGKAIQVFEDPDRIVIGIRKPQDIDLIKPIFSSVSDRLEWMGIESAEMTKHAINAFLATSVVFANEIAVLCESVGADALEVERGLKTEERIGPKAYVKPGSAFAGGTLARDINFLIKIGEDNNRVNYLFKAVKESNARHKDWAKRKCMEYLKDLKGRTITVLGLTYKPGTGALRRSWSVELCTWLNSQGAFIQAFDPHVKELPDNLKGIINLVPTAEDALRATDCIIVATEHPSLREMDKRCVGFLKGKVVLDANSFLRELFRDNKNINYVSVGRPVNAT